MINKCILAAALASALCVAAPAEFTQVDKDQLEARAVQGIPRAQYVLGYSFEVGLGREADLTKAAYWYKQSARQGDLMAKNNLSLLYREGSGVEKDVRKAYELMRESAEGGFILAIHNMGAFYVEGVAVKTDYGMARSWFIKSALAGYSNSQVNMGVMYYHGRGVEKDIVQAYAWFVVSVVTAKNVRGARYVKSLKKHMSQAEIERAMNEAKRIYVQIEKLRIKV